MNLCRSLVLFRMASLVLLAGSSYSTCCQAQTSVQDWQARAVRKYPALAIPGSAFNQRFVAAVVARRKTDPAFFADARWPMTLADALAVNASSAPGSAPPNATPAPTIDPANPTAKPAPPSPGLAAPQTAEYEAALVSKDTGLESAKFRWWAPADSPVRGVIVLLTGAGGDSRGLTEDAAWQSLATRTRFALLGCALVNPKDDPASFQSDPDGGVSDLLDQAVNALLVRTGQKIKDPPLAIWGHSAGGNLAQRYAGRHPERVVGAVLLRATAGPGSLATGKADVPMLIFVGQKDQPVWVSTALYYYARGHAVQADWTLALNPREGHEEGNTKGLALAYLAAAIHLRLPDKAASSVFSASGVEAASPQRLDKQSGWLGNPATYDVAPYNKYQGKKQDAIWLLDESTARAWQAYLRGP